jgi:hypothetical protein
MGLVREPALREPIERWLGDSDASLRASAALLLALLALAWNAFGPVAAPDRRRKRCV